MRLDDLCEAHRAEVPLKYLYFWGHTPRPDGAPSASCFSQWFDAPFEVDGQVYPTAEHFMMAEKARVFEDNDTLAQILVAPNPGAAKRLGRSVRGYSEEPWVAAREGAVFRANIAKFKQNEGLGSYLRSTGARVLVEASPQDRVWGIGLAATDPRAADPLAWNGLNLLGFVLMDVRDALVAGR